jgi:putative ABC transport system ATP-binding protein
MVRSRDNGTPHDGPGSHPVAADSLIELRGIERHYRMGDETVRALHDVDLAIARGEYLAVVGASGSGKTTLMNIVGCLDTPTSGSYLFEQQPVHSLNDEELSRLRNHKIGFVFQNFHLLPRMTALKNVELPLVYQGAPARQRRERAIRALEQVGLAERMNHRPNQLSGGQRQRVAVARALVIEPKLLLADEPTGNLDAATGGLVIDCLFEERARHGTTLLLITHDEGLAQRCARRIRLADGAIVEDQSPTRSALSAIGRVW